MFFVLGAFLWIMFAFWPAYVAKKKGYSFVLFFIFSLFTFVISLIVAYAMKDKNLTAQDIADDKAAEKILEREENQA